ncbi:DUF4233 domain-containing protein [Microbacterium esteraromaticum]|uniref:DUF4233 domain-containing protein n=2 Tax=Microbacterium esteraromaticum TaxID=57043 RepID=A0A7D8AIN6_9MICO|nr:DUF4233 domain-containing protein [Microbacterium esteraromaticum]
MACMSARAARPARAPRTLVQKLGSIVLGFEAIGALLAGLVIYGLDALPTGIPSWWGIVAGVVVAIALIGVAGSIAKPWAIPAGWVLQGVIALGGLLVPAILFVVLIFGGMWAYATIGGARIDRQRPAGPPAEPHTESE